MKILYLSSITESVAEGAIASLAGSTSIPGTVLGTLNVNFVSKLVFTIFVPVAGE